MSNEEDETPDVREWLLRAAELAVVAPPWQEALARLTDESSALERLAVYRTIRDSGWLTDDAALYLIAETIEEMADTDADKELRDLDQRVTALDQQYSNAEGEPWTDERAAEEYDELLSQHQSAWDKLFIGKLIELGEPEIADLYAADTEKFARRYAAGMRQFATPIQSRGRGEHDDLVCVASFVNLPQADLARNVIQREGIPAALGNANLVLWKWDYSNATGGVSVHVRRGDAPRAHHLLTAKFSHAAEAPAAWICRSCGQRITGGWEACWRCGRPIDDASEEMPDESETETDSRGASLAAARQLTRILVATIVLLCVLLPLALGLVTLAVVNAVFAGMVLFLMSRFTSSAETTGEAQFVIDSGDQPLQTFSQTKSSVTRAIVRRAWRAAIFGLSFPPLGFYAMRLLWKLADRSTQLGIADGLRVGLAFVLGLVEVMISLVFVGSILVVILDVVRRAF